MPLPRFLQRRPPPIKTDAKTLNGEQSSSTTEITKKPFVCTEVAEIPHEEECSLLNIDSSPETASEHEKENTEPDSGITPRF